VTQLRGNQKSRVHEFATKIDVRSKIQQQTYYRCLIFVRGRAYRRSPPPPTIINISSRVKEQADYGLISLVRSVEERVFSLYFEETSISSLV
jgi:hypothetical protein